MDHNQLNQHMEAGRISRKLFKNNRPQFPFKTTLSFLPLIRHWQEVGQKGNEMEKKVAALQLDLIKDAKELNEPILDPAILEKYSDHIELMMNSVFPVGIQDEILGAAIAPYHLDSFYCTRKLQEKMILTNDAFLKSANLSEERAMMYRTISACMAILEDYYGLDVVEKQSITLMLPDKKTGLTKHYAIDFITSFVEIEPVGKVRKISQKEVKEMMNDFFNIDKWLRLIPPHKFQFNGFASINLIDVTYQEILSSLKMDLLDKGAIVSKNSIEKIQEKVQTLLGIPDLKIGLAAFNKNEDAIMNYGNKNWNSIIIKDDHTFKCSECGNSIYARVVESGQAIAVDNLSKLEDKSPIEEAILKQGIKNLVIAPLIYDKEIVGVFELASKKLGQVNYGSIIELKEVLPLISLAVRRVSDELNNKVQATIKEKYTVIHPTVEWRFVKAAASYLHSDNKDEADIEEIVFKDVYPLYGLSDIRGSSSHRSKAIQEDLIEHLSLAKKVLEKGFRFNSMPIIKEMIFRINNTMMNIRYGLKSGDEVNVLEFIRQDIEPFIRNMKDWNKDMAEVYREYNSHLDPELGVLYKKRKEFEESLMGINDMIARYMEKQQLEAQKMFPHYFEMYKTDGVDYNIYVGQSLVHNKSFDEIYLKNLRLWQFITMVEITRKAEYLKRKLKNPLDIAQLILAQSTPLSIRFRTDEKQFDVDGAYNIRYEIVKKRIDKVKIKDSNERLTQPGRIAIVYSHSKEAREYRKYIKYLQSINLVEKEIEDHELEELQGASGLKALRIKVKMDAHEQKEKVSAAHKDDIDKIMEKIETEM